MGDDEVPTWAQKLGIGSKGVKSKEMKTLDIF